VRGGDVAAPSYARAFVQILRDPRPRRTDHVDRSQVTQLQVGGASKIPIASGTGLHRVPTHDSPALVNATDVCEHYYATHVLKVLTLWMCTTPTNWNEVAMTHDNEVDGTVANASTSR